MSRTPPGWSASRSFQNGYFAALCNRVGTEGAMGFAGESFACGPDGRVLARAGSGTEEILIADVDLAAAERSHARRLFLKHRRPELYAGWYGHPPSRTGSTGT